MSNFTINKGMANEFIITIKKNDTILPIIISPTDTFKLYLYKLSNNALIETLELGSGIEVYDDANGQIKITMDQVLVDSLEIARGDRSDYYYEKPMYRIAIECNTVDNGKFVAKVNKVYIC